MNCPKCGTQNVEHAQVCVSCWQVLTGDRPVGMPVQVKISGLAIASFVLGILSIFTLGLTALPAIVLGIIALVVIEKSGGRLTGLAFAIIGIVIPVFSFILLLGIVMPTLARIRQLSSRMACSTNLSGMGKALLLYANDYEDEFPRAGGRNSQWGQVTNWAARDRHTAYGVNAATGDGGFATISSCFYLLVKYAEVTPKAFICEGDAGTTEFTLGDMTGLPTRFELIDAWDFGPPTEAFKHCSYAYHMPFGPYALTVVSDPNFAVAADRNPFLKSPAADPASLALFKPDLPGLPGATQATAQRGNAIAHQLEGQNVLFLDTRVEFAKRAYCSIEDDNIYLRSRYPDKGDVMGNVPAPGMQPANRKDAMLVHDPDTWTATGRR